MPGDPLKSKPTQKNPETSGLCCVGFFVFSQHRFPQRKRAMLMRNVLDRE
jgi:hypothetical protein